MQGTVYLFLIAALAPATWGRGSGSGLTGLSGAPGENTCTRCHTGTVNGGGGALTITPDSTTFTAGQQIRLKITQADSAARRWGYELSARKSSAPTSALGTLTTPDSLSQITPAGGLQYAVQTNAGTQSGAANSASWELVWTAPADTSGGAVTFYVVGLACNNNGSDSGDRTYTATLTLQPAASSPGISGTVMALPQFVFGGGWSSSLYFGNTTTSATSVALKFIAEDGTELNVPAAGGSSLTMNLAGRGSATLEAPDAGALISGWVQATVPEGVIGYAVFRQSVAGRLAQEAVVPLSGTTTSTTTLLFDEASFTTGVAVLNPSTSPATVSITVYDEGGTLQGTSTLNLAAGAKQAFTLRDRAGLSAMAGRRGMVDFSASGGTVSVLGIRFNDAAFTSILPVER